MLNESGRSAEEMDDIVTYLLTDYSFMSRRSLVRVLKFGCLIVEHPQKKFQAVEIDLEGCKVPQSVIASCVRGVQSFVSSANYKAGAFFTEGTMDCVRTALASSHDFKFSSVFDPLDGLCCSKRDESISKSSSAFAARLASWSIISWSRA